MNIEELKKEYNYWLNRYYKAEEYYKKSDELECEKHLNLFHEIVRRVSVTKRELEKQLNRKLTNQEIFNGFQN